MVTLSNNEPLVIDFNKIYGDDFTYTMEQMITLFNLGDESCTFVLFYISSSSDKFEPLP